MIVKPEFEEGFGKMEISVENPFNKTIVSYEFFYLNIDAGCFLVDKDSRLLDQKAWVKGYTDFIATQKNIELTEKHWEVIRWARAYYQKYEVTIPIMIFLRNFNSKEFHKLFGSGDEPLALAGLPKFPYNY